jgi:hypothetical protein
MANATRLIELGMVPELAAEVASQINAVATGLAPVAAAVADPAAFSETPADISLALVAAGLMEAEA